MSYLRFYYDKSVVQKILKTQERIKKLLDGWSFLLNYAAKSMKKFKKWKDGWIDVNKAKSLHWMSLYNIVFDKF